MKVDKYIFGSPINTYSIQNSSLIQKKSNSEFHYDIKKIENKTIIEIPLKSNERIFGLTETVGWLNKRGSIVRTYNTDDPNHTPDKTALYSSIPFLFTDNKVAFLIDYPSEIVFDLGFSERGKIIITILDQHFTFYIWNFTNFEEACSIFRQITGKSYIPPKWAFGYQQSRWSYPDDDSVQKIADKFRELDIPCDAIYLDIDYMEDYKVFTFNKKRFPKIKQLVNDLKTLGIKLVPIIDPGVKIESSYDVFEEGISKEYFCTRDDKPMVANVWPGEVHFPDFYQTKVRLWWGSLYKRLTDEGIEGFWNDMNEPSIFFTPEKLAELNYDLDNLSKDREKWRFDQLRDKVHNLQNAQSDYEAMMQIDEDGKKISHHKIHNLYGKQMTQAAYEGLAKINPNKRFLLFSRSSYIGSHKFGGVWTGDNHSWWEHLRLNIQMVISLNFAGLLYCGADIGGFGGNSNADLLIRWIQLGMFFPLFRNHSIIYSRKQEPWAFDCDTTSLLRNLIKLRYKLIPYLYSEYLKAVNADKCYVKPLFFDFDQSSAFSIEDQFLIGDMMIAPIINPNQNHRAVFLPKNKNVRAWLKINLMKDIYEVVQEEVIITENTYNDQIVFLKENSAIVIGQSTRYVGEIPQAELEMIGLISDKIEYEYVNDDGRTKNSEIEKILLDISITNDELNIRYNHSGEFSEVKRIKCKILDYNGKMYQKTINV